MDIRSLRLLVVEDQAVQRQVAVGILKSLGVGGVAEAHDSGAALSSWRDPAEAPDILLCDLRT